MQAWIGLVTALALAPGAIAGQVWVVGPPPAPHQDLQDTIILAQEGDIVLVKAGTYESIRTVGRSITIVAEEGANVLLPGAIRVKDLDATRTIILSGLKATGAGSPTLVELHPGLYADHCAGQILAQDCTFASAAPTGVPGGGAAMVNSCAGVSLVRSALVGSQTGAANQTPGLYVGSGANVALDSVGAWGAEGKNAPPPPTNYPDGCPGEPGLRYIAPNGSPSFVFANDSTFVGGKGGNATWWTQLCTSCGYGGTGGDGIFARNAVGPLVLANVTAVGGAGGLRDAGCPGSISCGLGGNGAPGDPIYSGHYVCDCFSNCLPYPPTNYSTLAGSARAISGPRLVRDTSSLVMNFRGAPGERIDVAVTRRRPTFVYQAANSGVLHVPNPVWMRIGSVPPSGSTRHAFALPNLPLADPGVTFVVQARFIAPGTGQVRLSNPQVVVEVDATY